MKVIGIKHEVKGAYALNDYFKKFEIAMQEAQESVKNLDVAVGPDYSLVSYLDRDNDLIDFSKNNLTIEAFRKMSSRFSGTLLIPGTYFHKENGEISLCAPIFLNGKLEKEMYKETDASEANIAFRNGLIYKRGDSNLNHIKHLGKTIAIEICRDQGKQIIPKDTFLEVILAYDNNAGFGWGALGTNRNVKRHKLIVNGYSKDKDSRLVNFQDRRNNEDFVKPLIDSPNFSVFNLR
ncbi:MAG: hypothetical protein WC781_02205 [Candidatus Pacearchaeota archaeon]|jgi:hypothetical protein